jgi:hypothetical protein
MSARKFIPPFDSGRAFSGLQFLLLENLPLPFSLLPEEPAEEALPLSSAMLTPLHRQLRFLCLHDPYRNDFYLLNHFQKRGIKITLADIQRVRKECGLNDREAVCNTLLRLSACSGFKLNNRQISYIERFDPEYRDRDLHPSRPGELLVYNCLSGGRRLFDCGGGSMRRRVYIHLYVDMFTRYFFAKLSYEGTLASGLIFLQETIIPAYLENDLDVQTVTHSIHSTSDLKEFNDLESTSAVSSLGLQWLPTKRKFGIIENFERSILKNDFFESSANPDDLFDSLKATFQQWLTRYNSSSRLNSRRTISEY